MKNYDTLISQLASFYLASTLSYWISIFPTIDKWLGSHAIHNRIGITFLNLVGFIIVPLVIFLFTEEAKNWFKSLGSLGKKLSIIIFVLWILFTISLILGN